MSGQIFNNAPKIVRIMELLLCILKLFNITFQGLFFFTPDFTPDED